MVVRLSLYGSIASNDMEIVLHAFKSISGMDALHFEETQITWEPKYDFKPVLQAGQVNQIEQYRIFTKCPSICEYPAESDTQWTLQVQEVPEPGKNQKTILQEILTTKILEGNLNKTIENLGYQYKSQFWMRGFEFVVGYIVVRIFQLFAPEPQQLLDSSKQFTIAAWVDVEKLTDRVSIDTASNALEKLQADLKGIVTLELPSRTEFDTRVRK